MYSISNIYQTPNYNQTIGKNLPTTAIPTYRHTRDKFVSNSNPQKNNKLRDLLISLFVLLATSFGVKTKL